MIKGFIELVEVLKSIDSTLKEMKDVLNSNNSNTIEKVDLKEKKYTIAHGPLREALNTKPLNDWQRKFASDLISQSVYRITEKQKKAYDDCLKVK